MLVPALTFPQVPRLPYAELAPQLRSGDLLLCVGSSVMSQMIQHATGSIYSHVGFLLRLDALDRIMVLESVESIGIRACVLRAYVQDYNGTGTAYPGRLYLARHAPMDLSDELRLQSLAHTAVDLLGYPYDAQEILSIAARIIAAKFGLPTQPPRKNRTYICSEFVAEVYAAIGITIPQDNRGFIAPKDFALAPEVSVYWEVALPHG
jgi:hypothetical protein